jgi:hypothetical protein
MEKGELGVASPIEKSNLDKIKDKFLNQLFDGDKIRNYLETLGYTDIKLGFNGGGMGFKFLDNGSPRTLIFDVVLRINSITLYMSHVDISPKGKKTSNKGCLIGIVLAVGLVIWGIVAFFLGIDDYDSDYEEYNPYTEDFDGDGLHGDKDDHDILHNMPTMPTEPMDGE